MTGKSTRAHVLGALALPIVLGAFAEVSLAEVVLPLEKGMRVRLKRTPPPAGSAWGASAAERAVVAGSSGDSDDWVVGKLLEGALIGLAAGGGLAAIMFIRDSDDEFLNAGVVIIFGGLFAGGGAAAGALVGSQIKTEDWDEAPKPWNAVALLPRPGGAAVAAIWRF